MSAEVVGVPVASLEETIRFGLQGYSEVSGGKVEFDLDAACKLELTPDKPNSARSATSVKYLGEAAATLYVIAFAPGDGTGDESHQKLADTDTGEYPRATKVIGRNKYLTHSETHLTLLSRQVEDADAEPIVFAGNLDLLDGRFGKVKKLADLGQENYQSVMEGNSFALPRATLTVGYKGALKSDEGDGMWSYWRQRFGEVHAVYNPHEELQVCGFIGIPAEDCSWKDLDVLRALKSEEPAIIRSL